MKNIKKIFIIILFFVYCLNIVLADDLKKSDEKIKGIWIATVLNIDYPSEGTTDVSKIKTEALDILNDVQSMGLNTIFLQVRPTADAFYNSDIFPTSKYLTGKQGLALEDNFDVLKFWIDEAHKRNLKIHAWLNPYRITKNEANKPIQNLEDLYEKNPARLNPELCVKNANDWYFDPGLPEVRNLIVSGIQEILNKYDIDGIHFDDYFYPSTNFDDSKSYAKYNQGMSLEKWRIDNVNKLLKDVHQISKQKGVEFGISPFAIWKNKKNDPLGSNTNGMETYYSHYADCYYWVKNNLVDYIMPQVYFEIGHKAANYIELVNWWDNVVDGTGVDLYIGLAAYKSGNENPSHTWYKGTQLIKQLEYNKNKKNIKGEVYFSYRSFNNLYGVKNDIKEYYRNESNNSNLIGTNDLNDNKNQNNNLINPSKSLNKRLKTAVEILYNGDYLETYLPTKSIYGNSYNLRGVCNSNKPLYINGKLIKTVGNQFNIDLPIESGDNYFNLKNGNTTNVVKISKNSDFSSEIAKKFTVKEKLFPNVNLILEENEEIELYCIAPSKSLVKAKILDNEYVLDEKEENFNYSIYTKKVHLNSLNSKDYLKLGGIYYEIKGLGYSIGVYSNGEISIVNGNKSPYYAMINTKNSDTNNINNPNFGKVHLMSENTLDKVVYKNSLYTYLSTGYKVSNEDASIFLSDNIINNNVKFLGIRYEDNKEILSFKSDYNIAVVAEFTGLFGNKTGFSNTNLELRLPLTRNLENIKNLDNKSIINKISILNGTDYDSYILNFKDNRNINGYIIEHNKTGFDLIIYKHKISKNPVFPLENIVIMLDPGHGGFDTGAKGIKQDYEKNVVLSVSKIIKDKLEKLGATVYMTRYEDVNPGLNTVSSLHHRLRASYEIRPDVFISIHADAIENEKISGSSVHIVHEHSYPLAKMIKDNIINYTNNNDRGVKKDDFYVVRGHWCQSLLIELGFMTNREQNLWLLDKENQNIEADAIVDAIKEFYSK